MKKAILQYIDSKSKINELYFKTGNVGVGICLFNSL